MRTLILIFSFLAHLPTLAQFGIIADEEGFVNIRSSAEITNNIIETANSGEVVYCLEAEGDWLPVDYHLGQWNKSGYIHKTRVKLIEQFEEVPFVQFTDTSITYRMDTVTIQITTKSFEPDDNNLQYFQDTSGIAKQSTSKRLMERKFGVPMEISPEGNTNRSQFNLGMIKYCCPQKIYLNLIWTIL